MSLNKLEENRMVEEFLIHELGIEKLDAQIWSNYFLIHTGGDLNDVCDFLGLLDKTRSNVEISLKRLYEKGLLESISNDRYTIPPAIAHSKFDELVARKTQIWKDIEPKPTTIEKRASKISEVIQNITKRFPDEETRSRLAQVLDLYKSQEDVKEKDKIIETLSEAISNAKEEILLPGYSLATFSNRVWEKIDERLHEYPKLKLKVLLFHPNSPLLEFSEKFPIKRDSQAKIIVGTAKDRVKKLIDAYGDRVKLRLYGKSDNRHQTLLRGLVVDGKVARLIIWRMEDRISIWRGLHGRIIHSELESNLSNLLKRYFDSLWDEILWEYMGERIQWFSTIFIFLSFSFLIYLFIIQATLFSLVFSAISLTLMVLSLIYSIPESLRKPMQKNLHKFVGVAEWFYKRWVWKEIEKAQKVKISSFNQ